LTDFNGRELSESLARFLVDWMVWTNQPLGSVQHSNAPIVDVLAISKSYSSTIVRIYEIKVSRGDFQRDVMNGKFLKYMEYCNQFYFATPLKLITKEELPQGCGLITFNPDRNSWRTAKVAPRKDCTLPLDVMMSLLIKGYQNHFEEYRRLELERFRDYKDLGEATIRFGLKLSEDIVYGQRYSGIITGIKSEIEKLAGKQFYDIGWAVDWLRREVKEKLGQLRWGKDAAELLRLSIDLSKGNTWGLAKQLKEIAEKLERELSE
jgi:hypothetical protein